MYDEVWRKGRMRGPTWRPLRRPAHWRYHSQRAELQGQRQTRLCGAPPRIPRYPATPPPITCPLHFTQVPGFASAILKDDPVCLGPDILDPQCSQGFDDCPALCFCMTSCRLLPSTPPRSFLGSSLALPRPALSQSTSRALTPLSPRTVKAHSVSSSVFP